MWNDEDNNPYGAFDRHTEPVNDPFHAPAMSPPYNHPASPQSPGDDSPEYVARPETPSDDGEEHGGTTPEGYTGQPATSSYPRTKGVYESRIQQIIYENPELPILITHAGKNHEGGGGFIVYTIRTGDLEVRRRYSEFSSLRATLVNLHPTLIVPPIPEKHSMADYAAKPTKAKEDASIIELRKRMLGVFLNRCRGMREIREDGVWWRFLDPNASWSEVLHSHPASSVPKNNLKAPPLDPANPKPAHNWLPVPSSSAKLKAVSGGTAAETTMPGTVPGFLNRFPPSSRNLSEHELDPYFMNFEASTRELELLLQGNIEKVNRRTLNHLSSLATDLMELGARFNGFSLSEPSQTVAAAIERVGQAADNSYIETEELSNSLNATFAEPMRESAQFAGVVRNVLRYRVLKRIQEEMTRDELSKKKALLNSLERSELEAQRIEQYLNKTSPPASKPTRSLSDSSAASNVEQGSEAGRGSMEDTASIDSDFPPTHGETPRPSAAQGLPHRPGDPSSPPPSGHRHSSSGSFMANKIFGRISHAVHGFVDVDPERTRRDQIGKTKESLVQLEQALEVSEQDVKDASAGVLQDLKRFQREKENDLKRYMVAYARCHLDWARKNLETWTEAKDEVDKIVRRKVAAELRKAGGRTGFHFLHPSASSLRKPSRPLKRYGHHSSPASLQPTPSPTNTSSSSSSSASSTSSEPSFASKSHPDPHSKLRASLDYDRLSPSTDLLPRSKHGKLSKMTLPGGMDGTSASHDQQMQDAQYGYTNFRSSSPALKRPAAEMGGDEQRQDGEGMDMDPPSNKNNKEVQLDDSKPKKKNERPERHSRASSVDMISAAGESQGLKTSSEETTSSGTDSVYPTPSSMSTYTTSTYGERSQAISSHSSRASHEIPSLDEQVATVMQLVLQPPKEKQRGYIVSGSWLKRVLSRTSKGPMRDMSDTAASEGEIGPIDNSDLVLVTDPATLFKDEAGEPFVPLRPGLQITEDFEIFPQEAWDLVVKWYGLSKDSPTIVRYAHNTNAPGSTENFQYELNPPIFTILKLPTPITSASQSSSEKARVPVVTLASRHTPFQQWLRNVKNLTSIEPKTKVRVWRILEGLGTSGTVTPAASRSASPAPGAGVIASAGNSLIVDVNKFLALTEGSQREFVDMKDQTTNEKYNGNVTLHLAGLSGDSVIVLEEQIGGAAGGEWVSDTAKYGSNRLASLSTSGSAGPQNKLKTNAATASGRTSPAPTTVTRGRKRSDGKTPGVTGLSNLGNTCYMNSALQCVRSVEELTRYFLANKYKKDLNPSNPLSHNGEVAKAYANLLHQMFDENGTAAVAPRNFKLTVGRYGPSFSGYGQQDSQEFVLFLLDGLQEDLNRIYKKPYIEKPDSTDDMVHDRAALEKFADRNWEIYKARNDSVVTDLFAGMYKSTVVCPVCHKVSIIFDPFSNLTLQLPIENVWSKQIIFFPAHDKPVSLDVEIDKHASIKALKEYVARKVKSDPQRLVMAEIYLQKIRKLFANTSSISDEQIADTDTIAMYELEMIPTSYDPDKAKKQSYSMLYTNFRDDDGEVASFDSEKADRILVPIINRVFKPSSLKYARQRPLFGVPRFAVITREEAMDYDAILRKILAQVDTLTTQDILREDEDDAMIRSNSAEDSDAVVTNDDDANSNDSKIKMGSVESEDGLVDVSMRDATDSSSQDGGVSTSKVSGAKVLQPQSFIPPSLRNLFEVKFVKTNDPAGITSTAIDDSKDLPSMMDRVRPKKAAKRGAQRMKNASPLRSNNSPVSSEDELAGPSISVQIRRHKLSHGLTNYSSSEETKGNSVSETDSDIFPTVQPVRRKEKDHKRKTVGSKKRGTPANLPYIRPGEAIVLDWNESAHDSIFGGDAKDKRSFRGAPTWEGIQRLPDPELTRKRQLRQTKKRSGITLDECLDEFGREEILSENDAWYCPRCKEHRRASKRFELWTVPDILVMHLKRFSANRQFRDKLDVYVDFPLELDMTGRAQAPDDGKSMLYDLIAVDNHYGGLGGGHYTACAKSFVDGNWYEYDDSRVSKKVNPNSVITSAAYLLFYRRRSDHPLGGPYLASITEAAYQKPIADSDSPEDSDGNPGEGKRLDDSSRNGSSSALAEAAAAHQAGDGGLQEGILNKNDEDGELPEYLDTVQYRPVASRRIYNAGSMEVDGYEHRYDPNPISCLNIQHWSFGNVHEDSYYGNNDDQDDNSSMKAMGGGDSDSDTQIQPLGNSDGLEPLLSGMQYEDEPVNIMPMDDDDDDENPPVVELHVPDEDSSS
ncbi:ubiquitin C-terminal hydrolase [Emydomyces testavorans]|uniref:Ubiquitin C-terminal hydrolase n=1 Tax=Emydomyces testavorans TaxID=2070801 RepID=A0AAF0IGH5_9EURO|nr:ubiquitin C-terminal hydrolase [Emydomyces testavorans]